MTICTGAIRKDTSTVTKITAFIGTIRVQECRIIN